MMIDRAGIARLIPHAGEMCLLDGVLSWDASTIRCTSDTHRAAQNPLRHAGRLGIVCGVEYAAQAMALHGALSGGGGEGAATAGYLASVRALTCHVDRLDEVAGTLLVSAERLHGEGKRVIYAFALCHNDRVLLDGRAAVVIGALPRSEPWSPAAVAHSAVPLHAGSAPPAIT
jgi:predicted hotdog family 3-hydroxylacyl-ACP dehydratase